LRVSGMKLYCATTLVSEILSFTTSMLDLVVCTKEDALVSVGPQPNHHHNHYHFKAESSCLPILVILKPSVLSCSQHNRL
jgi:hypothetical protein